MMSKFIFKNLIRDKLVGEYEQLGQKAEYDKEGGIAVGSFAIPRFERAARP
jgi:hypothetical protein